MLAFEVIAVPNITRRVGIRAIQRVAAVIQVPAYLMVPVLSIARVAGLPVTILSLVLLCTCYACTSLVGACHCRKRRPQR